MSLADVGRDYLEHFGVKGMKWGVRRGKTIAGRRKAGTPSVKPSEDAQRHRTNRKKHVAQLSDKELKDLANRLQNEQNLARLTSDGKTALDKILAAGNRANNVIALIKSPAGQAAIAAGAFALTKVLSTSKAVSSIGKF